MRGCRRGPWQDQGRRGPRPPGAGRRDCGSTGPRRTSPPEGKTPWISPTAPSSSSAASRASGGSWPGGSPRRAAPWPSAAATGGTRGTRRRRLRHLPRRRHRQRLGRVRPGRRARPVPRAGHRGDHVRRHAPGGPARPRALRGGGDDDRHQPARYHPGRRRLHPAPDPAGCRHLRHRHLRHRLPAVPAHAELRRLEGRGARLLRGAARAARRHRCRRRRTGPPGCRQGGAGEGGRARAAAGRLRHRGHGPAGAGPHPPARSSSRASSHTAGPNGTAPTTTSSPSGPRPWPCSPAAAADALGPAVRCRTGPVSRRCPPRSPPPP
ncbi:hypothetical protein SFUMM280S_10914 [Streptomyces fumanus]